MDNITRYETQLMTIARSAEQYPVDFDQAWQWVGYARKDSALRALKESFIEGIDFNLHNNVEVRFEGGREVRRPFDTYFLTVDCFKSFCMMAGTEKGKEVRKYYLRIEKEYFALRQQFVAPKSFSKSLDEVKQIENFLNQFGFNVRFVPIEDTGTGLVPGPAA
jgi:phage anti-repressor protein